ncbi:MAG: PaaI family thioesterase [Betaproteobacteria bacterium]|nr:PaaI family thioesterase [Betaproteobacteria bacterium]
MDGKFDIEIPYVQFMGMRMLSQADGKARVAFDPKPEHFNSWKSVHGGVLMSLLDVTMGTAARALDASCIGASTVEMKTNFINPAQGPVFTDATALRAGRSLIYCEAEVTDLSGTLLAKANGTFKLIYPKGQ